jgi:diguanylate cyclase (GGDEF)-like protein
MRANGLFREWRLWSLPRRALALVLGVHVLAVVVGVAALRGLEQPSRSQTTFLLVAGAGIVLPRIRAAARGAQALTPYQGMENVQHVADDYWMVAVALVLPLPQGVLLVVLCELLGTAVHQLGHRTAPSRWIKPRPPVRMAFSISVFAVAVAAASSVFTSVRGPAPFDGRAIIGATLAGLTIQAVQNGLLFSVLHLSAGESWARLFRGEAKTFVAEVSQKSLGVLIWVAWERAHWSILFAFPLLLSFERAQRHAVLLQQARTDGRTALLNASHWHETADAAIARSAGSGSPIAVALLDLDHFKQVNDRHGHGAGDQVLQQVAQRISASVRPGDVVGRFGGEEFSVLLTRSDLEDAADVAERIRETMSRTPMDCTVNAEAVALVVTCSIGIANVNIDSKTALQEALERADQALYRAKESGRNRVEVAETSGARVQLPM